MNAEVPLILVLQATSILVKHRLEHSQHETFIFFERPFIMECFRETNCYMLVYHGLEYLAQILFIYPHPHSKVQILNYFDSDYNHIEGAKYVD